MEFHGTGRVSEIGGLEVPWNSMELLVLAKLAHSMEFHGTAQVSEIGALEVPWNSMNCSCHRTGALEIPCNSMELLASVPWYSMEPYFVI